MIQSENKVGERKKSYFLIISNYENIRRKKFLLNVKYLSSRIFEVEILSVTFITK